MRNTRKQIIELISDYMDKSLSEGCLVEIDYYKKGGHCKEGGYEYQKSFTTKIGTDSKTIVFKREELNHINKLETNEEKFFHFYKGQSFFVITKILGHYDITAVLKYICDYMSEINNQIPEVIVKDKIIFEYINADKDDMETIIIPNKPLHLYTEQEEKDLLELLNKLGQQ